MESFYGMLFFFSVLWGSITGGFCFWLAGEKGYIQKQWFWLGFFFGLLAFIALCAVPKKQ